MKTQTFVNSITDLPYTEFWMIVKSTSVHHEADERSRTNPGHGYPAYPETFVNVHEIFTNEEEFKATMISYAKDLYSYHKIRGFHVDASYTQKTTVEAVKV